jgi:transketolase
MGLEPLVDKWISFGWHVEEVDGHDISKIIECLKSVQAISGKPSIMIAHTVKGKGVSFVEADYTYHGRALNPEKAALARKEILCS